MPQNAIKPAIIGAYSALRGDLWKFVTTAKQKNAAMKFTTALGDMHKIVLVRRNGKIVAEQKPCSANDTLESGLMALAEIALNPSLLTADRFGKDTVTPVLFARLYSAEPDFVLSVLAFIRRRWKPLRTTKARRLFHFMADASKYFVKPLPHQKPRCISNCSDGEIATAFANTPGGAPVELGDVTKARKAVAAAVKKGLSVARRFKLQPQPVCYLHGAKVEALL